MSEIDRTEVANIQDAHRILIVEDRPELRALLAEQLTELGYRCDCAASCEEGRKAVGEQRYACCLVDLGLPDGSGLELLAEFSEIDPHLVAVMLTGDASAESIIKTMRAGAFDYLIKPVDMVTLRIGISRAVAHHEAIHERAVLVDLLRDERNQLKERIDAATMNIRRQAEDTEAANAMLHSLLRVTRLSASFHSDEDLLRGVYEEVSNHLPVTGTSICDVVRETFHAVYRDRKDLLYSSGDVSRNGHDEISFHGDPEHVTSTLLARFTGLDPSRLEIHAFPQSLSEQYVGTVAFYFPSDFSPGSAQLEFLKMCAHFVALEWQRSHLILHAAQQASLGNIAVELAKSSLHSLTALRTAADLIGETDTAADRDEGLSIILENIEFLTTQTQGFFKMSGGRGDEIETVRLDQYIDQTLELLAAPIENRGVTIRKSFQADSECLLLNGSALARTFLDLISDAVRAAGYGGEVRVHLRATDHDHILCEIACESLVAHRSHAPTTSGDERVLSPIEKTRSSPSFLLAQRTVQSCGGKLTFEPGPDAENVFRITLPRNALSASTTQVFSR